MRIIDFGEARQDDGSEMTAKAVAAYNHPDIEQGNYNSYVDIYCLGVIAYHLLTGKQMFYGDDRTRFEIPAENTDLQYDLTFVAFI